MRNVVVIIAMVVAESQVGEVLGIYDYQLVISNYFSGKARPSSSATAAKSCCRLPSMAVVLVI